MKKSLRWGAAVATATVATLTLASCGFSNGSGGSAGGSTQLNLMVASYSDNTKAEWQGIIKDFEAANKGTTVNLDVESWTDINNVIKTRIQAGKQPDILNIDAFAGFAADNLLYPAKDIVSAKTLDDFQPAFNTNASIDGTQWGLPFIASARALFYNKDDFAKAGITDPPKTWADFEADAVKLKAAGVTPYGMPLGSEEAQAETAIWFYGAGGGYGDAKKLTIDSAENVTGATEMQKIITQGLTEANPGSTNRTPLMNVFIQGQLGMQIGLPPIVGQIKDKNPSLKYGIAPIPTKDGSPFTLGVADHLMAFKNKTDKKDAIKKFLDYFYTPAVYTKWVGQEGFLPTTKSGADQMGSDATIKPFLDLLPNAKFYPSTNPNWSAAQGAIQSQIGQLGQGANPSDLLKSIQAKASGQ
ncbi:extracellular solute-binding protein [Leifsonia shinshuensis]|uniref:Multiple sugar transport system substrate-binding protein n=1 Tax=Leifsonia shinshuensis TaxID=150026 RepID=A0A853CS29_9MICO|nr:extracellular solute-binding protein [Leifsonia shinshuensis]NYJ23149.1 multiple sugar transport system substrate-binding protein [Leifsonia shinshuensis]